MFSRGLRSIRAISFAASLGQQPELRPRVAGQHVRVRVGGDVRDHAHEHVLRRAGGLEAVDVVGVVDHDQPDAVLDRERDLLVGLGVAVVDDQRRVDAGLQRGQDLAAAGDVEPEALLDHHALDGGGGERLGGEHDARARPAGAQLGDVLAGAGAQRRLGHDQRRRAELSGEVVGAAAADEQHPVGVERAAGGEELQQGVHGAGR